MQLTQLVYDREVIWNRSHPDHSVLAKRYEAFDEVARELGMSMPELKHHWRTLGGKVVTKITNTIAAIISTRQRDYPAGQLTPFLRSAPPARFHKQQHGQHDRDKCRPVQQTHQLASPEQCKQILAVMTELARQFSAVQFVDVPVEELSEVALKQQIDAVLTVIFFQAEKAIDRIDGVDIAALTTNCRKLAGAATSVGGGAKEPLEKRTNLWMLRIKRIS
ncbi:conserved hypothetical protein [Culex quinquefasciatus]|uniref:MADF domain-containing protein n=1 Tax=Culex quinquefasciatus TaxID=7176 RepID=B0WP23_CULQU|nr:conserved hypothetical protein [Culex quinquefasciatus]|eukprot:XP_001850457.1 conserved hypothetical protein [Culex quinquefasciatus]